MFETQYNEEMEAEVRRLEAKKRAADAGHPEWENACDSCGCRIIEVGDRLCGACTKAACSNKLKNGQGEEVRCGCAFASRGEGSRMTSESM